MSQLIVSQDHCIGSTSISNVFIDMFMKDANDAQLKIYLYLIRVINSNLPVSISDMADKFNHTEKDVIRSLQYWERNHLLSLDYDADSNIVGIHLHMCIPQQETVKPMAPIVPLKQVATIVKPAPAVPEFNLKTIPDKPTYSADELSAYSSNEDFRLLLLIAEQYLCKQLSPSDIRSLLYIYKELKFSTDLTDTLLQYCVEQEQKSFRYIEKVATAWYEQGITTPKQALTSVKKYDKTAMVIMKALGKRNTPTAKETEFIHTWTVTYGFDMDIIVEACNRTVLATDAHRFEYADGILANWMKNKVTTLADIEACDLSYKKKTACATVSKPAAENKFNMIPKHNYDFDALERDILSN